MKKLKYDHTKYFGNTKHFVLPPRKDVKPEFLESLKDITQVKLKELKDRKGFLLKSFKNRNKFLEKFPETKKRKWFKIYFNDYVYHLEIGYIDRWIEYWKNLIPKNKVTNRKPKGLTEEQIQRAREYPIENLITGERKQAGINKLKTLCPFHEDKSPSFIIYTNKNSAHCYGCQKHFSNAIDYVMEGENINFTDAVRRLL